jgi:hypothetical protein
MFKKKKIRHYTKINEGNNVLRVSFRFLACQVMTFQNWSFPDTLSP